MKTKTIRQSVMFKAIPKEIYEMMMDSKKHSKFTGAKADISKEVDGKFTAYDGYIDGINVELIPNKRIVQKWRGSDWPEGHYSIATFELKKVASGTELIFTQKDVPEDQYESISKGWIEHYWDKMKRFLEKKKLNF
ncbi:MAG: SRPBCC domain-containing protein [Candidatus Aenigmarchaeota archaeon]|nr:SRPBCC domain-containing protein [Candidatus Aenigmarchaeota archaeon]